MYHIDCTLSKQFNTIVIVTKKPLPELQTEERTFRNRSDLHDPFTFYRLRPSQSYVLLQKMAQSKNLFFNDTPLICDFFSRLSLSCLATSKKDLVELTWYFEKKNGSWPANDSALILPGKPHIVIHDGFLRFTDVCLPILERIKKPLLSQASYKAFIKDLEDEPVELLESFTDQLQEEKMPHLQLTDATLGFANALFSSDDHAQELLESGFIKKSVGSSTYFCPLDKAKKAIFHLLEKKWRVTTKEGKDVLAQTKESISIEDTGPVYKLSGSIYFHEKKVELPLFLHAATKNLPYLSLDSETVALFDETKLENLIAIAPELTIESDALVCSKKLEGIVDELLPAEKKVAKKEALQALSLFSGTLRPYQEEGVLWMQKLFMQNSSGLLADEMGLGKTVQLLAFLSTLPDTFSTLISVPTSLIDNWMREIATFLPKHSVHVYQGPNRTLKSAQITITSHAICRIDAKTLAENGFDTVVVDEAQVLKNKKTQSAKAHAAIPCRFRLSITGTPIENSIDELFSHFSFLDDTLFSHPLYQTPSEKTLSLVRKKARPFILRRKKCDVAKELPEKVEQTIFITMNDEESDSYKRLLTQIRSGLIQKRQGDKLSRLEILEGILRLRQHALSTSLLPQYVDDVGSEKLNFVLEDIETLFLENKKVLLFSQFQSMLVKLEKEVQKRGIKSVRLDGSTKNRQEVVDQFQNDPETSLFLMSLKAGGTGLNLTQADYVLLYDPWWNQAQEMQAIDRAHRIGRKDTVFVKRYIVKETIEEKILELQKKKHILATSIIEGDDDILQEAILQKAISTDELFMLL